MDERCRGYADHNTIMYIFVHSRVGPVSHSEKGITLTIVLGYTHILDGNVKVKLVQIRCDGAETLRKL